MLARYIGGTTKAEKTHGGLVNNCIPKPGKAATEAGQTATAALADASTDSEFAH